MRPASWAARTSARHLEPGGRRALARDERIHVVRREPLDRIHLAGLGPDGALLDSPREDVDPLVLDADVLELGAVPVGEELGQRDAFEAELLPGAPRSGVLDRLPVVGVAAAAVRPEAAPERLRAMASVHEQAPLAVEEVHREGAVSAARRQVSVGERHGAELDARVVHEDEGLLGARAEERLGADAHGAWGVTHLRGQLGGIGAVLRERWPDQRRRALRLEPARAPREPVSDFEGAVVSPVEDDSVVRSGGPRSA